MKTILSLKITGLKMKEEFLFGFYFAIYTKKEYRLKRWYMLIYLDQTKL